MRSRTIHLDLEKINRDEALAAIVPRLSMACNDISIANICLSDFKDKMYSKKNSINTGASMYFVRLQVGHIEEGLKIINEIRTEKQFRWILNTMKQEGKKSYSILCNCLNGTDKKWAKYYTPIRNNLSFHYNHKGKSKLIRKALRERIEKKNQKISRVTVGHITKSRFELGDEIVDTIVCRNIFGISYDIDFEKDRKELDDILMYGSRIGEAFMAFGAEFIYKIAEN